MTTALLHRVETRMIDVLSASSKSDNTVLRAVHHHLRAGGSRVRACLCIDASIALNVSEVDAVTLATICELLHNASLIQDDLIDRASPRRGVPSVWAAFDDATAVCAGDLMLASAYFLVAELEHTGFLRTALQLVHKSAEKVILSQGAENGPSPLSMKEYEMLAKGKSGSLLSLPLELSLLLSGQSHHLETAQRVAAQFAVAYQMSDDLDDYDQDREAGSLNAVSVALDCGAGDLTEARGMVRDRAIELLESSIQEADALPQNCAGTLTMHAHTMLTAFRDQDVYRIHSKGIAQHA